MPELPDVEAFRKVLADCAQGAEVGDVGVYDTGVLHGTTAARLRRTLRGRTFAAPQRHGKWLRVPFEDGGDDGDGGDAEPVLMVHFGMTGRLVCCAPGEELHPHDRVVWTVAGAGRAGGRELRYRDQRKLKGLWLTDPAGADRMLAGQGPDAAALTRAGLDERLGDRRGGLKSALTDQTVVAGLGNLLADEILWRARLAPGARVRSLSGDERGRLHRELRGTVRASVRAGRVPDRAGWLTGARDAPECPRCGGGLRHGRVAGRGTVWCPRCQDRA